MDAKGSRLTHDHLPEEWETWAIDAYQSALGFPYSTLQTTILNWWLEFHDYWVAVPGKDGRKLDWFATWRNNVRRCIERDQRRQPTRHASQPPANNAIGKAAAARARDSGRPH